MAKIYMTKTGIENKKLIQDKELEEKNIAQRDKASKRSLAGSIVGGAARFLGSLVGGAGKGDNDVSWYTNVNSELSRSVSSLALQVFQGSEIKDRWSTWAYANKPFNYEVSVIGLLAYPNYILGDATDVTDNALNIAAQRMFTSLRALNSRVREYEQGDIMQVFLASTSLAAFIVNIGRAIRAAQTFSAAKRYIGDALLIHCGFNPGEFRLNLPRYKEFYNQMVQYFNDNIVLPVDFAYAKRELWKMANVFTDQDLACGQVILFDYPGYCTYDEANAAVIFHKIMLDGTGNFTDSSGNEFHLDGIKTIFREMYAKLVYSAALTTMYADIKSGDIRLLSLPPMYDDKGLTFQDIDEVKTQIMNAKLPLVGVSKAATSRFASVDYDYSTDDFTENSGYTVLYGNAGWDVGSVTQNTSGLLVSPHTSIPTTDVSYLQDGEAFALNYYTDNITAEDILTSTRLVARWGLYNNTYACLTGGMDVLIAMSISHYKAGHIKTNYTNGAVMTSDYSGYNDTIVATITGLSQMDWAPQYAIVPGNVLVSANYPAFIQWQLGNPCTIGAVNLTLLHRVCAISLFSLPIVSGVDSRKVYSKGRK